MTPPPPTSPALITLPTELLNLILSEIELAPDLISLALTCRRFFHLVYPTLTSTFAIAKTIEWTQNDSHHPGMFDDNPALHKVLLRHITRPALGSFVRNLTVAFDENAPAHDFPLVTNTVSHMLWDQLSALVHPSVVADMTYSSEGGHQIWLLKFLLSHSKDLCTLRLWNLLRIEGLSPFVFAATRAAAPHQRVLDEAVYLQKLTKLTLNFHRGLQNDRRRFVAAVWPWLFLPSLKDVEVDLCQDITPYTRWRHKNPLEQLWEDVRFYYAPMAVSVVGKSSIEELVVTRSYADAMVWRDTMTFMTRLTKLVIDCADPYDPLSWQTSYNHRACVSPLLDDALLLVKDTLVEFTLNFLELLPYERPDLNEGEAGAVLYPTGFRLLCLPHMHMLRKLSIEPRFIIGAEWAEGKPQPSLGDELPPNVEELRLLGCVMTELGYVQSYRMAFSRLSSQLITMFKGQVPAKLKEVDVVGSENDSGEVGEDVTVMWGRVCDIGSAAGIMMVRKLLSQVDP